MGKFTSNIPFTELCERAAEISRSASENDKSKIRGTVNDIATKEIGGKFDWNFLEVSSALHCLDKYSTGTVSATTGDTTIVFTGATIPSNMKNARIKIGGNDIVYDFNYAGTSSGTVSPAVAGTKNISGQSFNLFKAVYSLAPDFDRFPVKGGLILWQGGKPVVLPEKRHIQYYDEYSASPGTPACCRIIESDTAGNPQVEVVPPPQYGVALKYDYLKIMKPLRQTSMGTVTITSSQTAVVGSTDARFTEANTGDYIRVNANGTKDDSEWYRIVAIANDSALTIAAVFVKSSVATATYVISSIPEMPSMLHLAILHGAVRELVGNQDDPMYAYHNVKMAEILTDAKVRYVTRMDSVELDGDYKDYDFRR